jgi:DMSO/TMAO reductase YedYZ molybdopterin-dependent catalytic subunit
MPDNPSDKVARLKRANPKREFDPHGGRVPPGQYLTEKFPVLHYGGVPNFDPQTWDLKIWGLVEHPIRLTWDEFRKLPTRRTVVDIHCVTRWSKLDTAWEGVLWSWVMEAVQPRPEARFVMAHCEKVGTQSRLARLGSHRRLGTFCRVPSLAPVAS